MKFNKQERHDIYIKALTMMANHRTFVKDGILVEGVCDILYTVINNPHIVRGDILNHFPEIAECKPKRKEFDRLWWETDIKGTKKRFMMVINAISKTSPL